MPPTLRRSRRRKSAKDFLSAQQIYPTAHTEGRVRLWQELHFPVTDIRNSTENKERSHTKGKSQKGVREDQGPRSGASHAAISLC